MPLGNLTSQFFANVYLNELDYFVKHTLNAKYYIRYVDDFVIINISKERLEEYKYKTSAFLHQRLALQLHPDKSRIIPTDRGVNFLGLKIFAHHRLIKKKNLQHFQRKLQFLCSRYEQGLINYDAIYDFLEGWVAYTKNSNTHVLQKRILNSVEQKFNTSIATKEVNRHIKENKGEHLCL